MAAFTRDLGFQEQLARLARQALAAPLPREAIETARDE